MNRWVKTWESILQWGWYTDVPTCHLFQHLIIKANWTPGTFMGREIKAGQIPTSVGKLSAETGLSVQQIRTALEKLKKTGEITIEATNKYTIITVVNYGIYQGSGDSEQQTNNNQITNNQQTDNKQITNDQQQYKNTKNKEYKNKRNIYRVPTLEEVTEYCKERQNNVDPQRFIDYYASQHWKKANGQPLADWKAAVRTWEKNNYDKPRNSQPSITVDTPDYIRKQIEEMDKKFGW